MNGKIAIEEAITMPELVYQVCSIHGQMKLISDARRQIINCLMMRTIPRNGDWQAACWMFMALHDLAKCIHISVYFCHGQGKSWCRNDVSIHHLPRLSR